MHTVMHMYVRGRKDKRLQRVEHIPVDSETRCLQPGLDYYVMRLWDRSGAAHTQLIRRDRIEYVEVGQYGQLESIPRHSRQRG